MEQSKKNICLYVLKVLKEFSDEKHHITQTEIIKKLKEYGIDNCDRKTIARSIDYLIEFGYTIIKKVGGGCYFINENFDMSELTFLVDSVFSSQTISQKQAESLVERITSDVSVFDRKRFSNIFKSEELIRTDNRQVFYNIDQINSAIQQNKQISFTYNRYGKDKKLVPRMDYTYIINPYFMVNSKGKYFLVCNKNKKEDVSNYRIDYITNIKLLDADRRPVESIMGYEKGINQIKYANEHIYMFTGDTKMFTLKLSSDKMINEVIDWFGKEITIYESENGDIFVKIKTNENAMIYWCLQYGQNVEIVSPDSARTKIKEILFEMIKKYNYDIREK